MKENEKHSKDYLSYEKGCKVAKEITSLMQSNEQHRLDEFEELSQWLETNPTASDSASRLANKNLYEEFDRQERCDETRRLLKTIQNKKSKVRKMDQIRLVCFSSAAAIIAFSFLLYLPQTKKIVVKPEIATISTGKISTTPGRPTLILDNGENIDLTAINDKNIHNVKTEKGSDKVNVDTVEYNTIVIPKQFTYHVILADGSTVYLNANSELRYPVKFTAKERKVYLKGEGYFEVEKGDKPFIVSALNIEVKVYGTKFNINSHNINNIQTTLVEGSVGVQIAKKGTLMEVQIKPSQMLMVDATGENQLKTVDTDRYTIWMQGFIRNDEESLSNLLDNIAKWYGVEFVYSENIRNIKVSASLNNERPLAEIIEAIEIISGVKIIKKEENQYMVL